MGKAYKPPAGTYTRERFVSAHAVQRLRERIVGTELSHRPDDDVGNALDQAVVWATKKAGLTEAILDDGEPALLAEITDYLPSGKEGNELFSVVKRNHVATPREAIVTVLAREQVDTLRRTRWKPLKPTPAPIAFNPALPTAALGALPTGVSEATRQTLQLAKAAATTKETAAATEPIVRRTRDVATVLVTYRRGASNALVTDGEYVADLAPGRIAELVEDPDVDPDTIRVWVEKPFTVKREVKVELDL